MDAKFVTYEEFGAKGDGFTDDFAAIKRAHDYANENGLSVMARAGAKYYIRDTRIDGTVETVVIKTDTIWEGAEFTIDDRDIDGFTMRDMSARHVFTAASDYEDLKIEDRELLDRLAGIGRETKRIELGLGYPALIIPFNTKDRVYKRKGYGGFEGGYTHEVILLDRDGNVDPETPIMFNYPSIDYINVYRTDIKPITIKGGTVTTRACRVEAMPMGADGKRREMGYFFRGLNIRRSYTTVDGLKHYVTDEFTPKEYVLEDKHSPPYYGFFSGDNATHILFKNCVLTGRRYYHVQGTYDFAAGNVNKIVLDGCTQHNFWVTYDEESDTVAPAGRDDEGAFTSMCWPTLCGKRFKLHWGLGGTNFCKNMEYLNSTLSRFDAHAGLYNGKIINCTVNYMALTGNGEFTVEDTDWYSEGTGPNSASMFHLRADYGSTWEGDIKVKNLNAYVHTEDKSFLFLHSYNNWGYGYQAHMPNISIEGLSLFDIDTCLPLPDDYTLDMLQGSPIYEPAMHLASTANVKPWFPYVDKDGDGLVDGTDIPYDKDKLRENWGGIQRTDISTNLNEVAPPEYIKLTSCKGYTLNVPKTFSKERGIPDINGNENEGFFGSTRFIYGDGEGEYYQGTNHEDTKTFKFFEY